METEKRKALEAAGWKLGDAADFLGMDAAERLRLQRMFISMEADQYENERAPLIRSNPLDDSLRIELENHLAERRPEAIQLELLRRERQIAELLDRGESVDALIEAYQQFRNEQSNFIWDMRGSVDHLYRPFSLWLTVCNSSRVFALQLAVQNKLRTQIDPSNVPIELTRGIDVLTAYSLHEKLLDFVRRYRGPNGTEPELADGEVSIVMRATYSEVAPGQKMA
ncbi:MAG: hypothetical protein SGJ20_07860 [Planctomycetota bacterium]|nr:hypothetical protein [Planctomycetota bacterium]